MIVKVLSKRNYTEFKFLGAHRPFVSGFKSVSLRMGLKKIVDPTVFYFNIHGVHFMSLKLLSFIFDNNL